MTFSFFLSSLAQPRDVPLCDGEHECLTSGVWGHGTLLGTGPECEVREVDRGPLIKLVRPGTGRCDGWAPFRPHSPPNHDHLLGAHVQHSTTHFSARRITPVDSTSDTRLGVVLPSELEVVDRP